MEEKLKSILRQTNWSLVLKALIFAAAWWALPFWLFFLIALYLYFVPITGTGKVSVPFFVLVIISFFQGQSILAAILFAAIFYFILLIRDLLIIGRRSAHEILILVLAYLLVRSFFLNAGASFSAWTLAYSLIAAWAVSAMILDFIKNFSGALPAAPEVGASREERSFYRMLGWMEFLLMWQLLIVGTFLPLDFLYQSAIVFLIAAILMDLVPEYVFGELSKVKVLTTSTVLFAFLVIVIASGRWIL